MQEDSKSNNLQTDYSSEAQTMAENGFSLFFQTLQEDHKEDEYNRRISQALELLGYSTIIGLYSRGLVPESVQVERISEQHWLIGTIFGNALFNIGALNENNEQQNT